MKLVKTIQNGHHTAKVYSDKDWNEHRVQYFKDGVYLGEDCDSFEDDRDAAIGTANAELTFMNTREDANV